MYLLTEAERKLFCIWARVCIQCAEHAAFAVFQDITCGGGVANSPKSCPGQPERDLLKPVRFISPTVPAERGRGSFVSASAYGVTKTSESSVFRVIECESAYACGGVTHPHSCFVASVLKAWA